MSKFRFCLRPLPIYLLLTTLVWGCGGGGGGGGGTTPTTGGTLNYFANFTPGTAGGPTGLSEVVKVTSIAGAVLQTKTVSSTGLNQTPKQLIFTSLPNATLLLQATLYSGTNGTGTAVGSAAMSISGNGITNLVTAMGKTISTVTIGPAVQVLNEPSTLAITKGSSQQLVASPQDSANDLLFEASLPNWTLTSGSSSVGSISAQGMFTGSGLGVATVNAAFGSITSSVQVSVTSVSTGTWTIMLFLNSANDLDVYAPPNVQQIEQVAQTPTSNTKLLIQWKLTSNTGSDPASHLFDGTRRFLAVKNGIEFLQDLGSGVNMGSPSTLKDFVSWSVKNYPAQHYMLIMWDHGNGWFMKNALPTVPRWRGISYDDEFQTHIDVNQIDQAVSPTHLDIISFDACLMQQLEVEDQLTGTANYMVCSEDNTPGPGYPYDKSFGQFFTNSAGTPVTLAKGVVDGFINTYDGDSDYNLTPLSHSVVDLTKVGAVSSALNNFSSSLLAGGTNLGSTTQKVRNSLINYAAGDGYNYYDLGGVAQAFVSASPSSAIDSAGEALISAEKAAVIYSRTDDHSPNSTGMEIDFGSSNLFDSYESDYVTLLLAQQTHWAQFLSNSTLNP